MLVFTVLLLLWSFLFHSTGGRAWASVYEAVTTGPTVDVGYAAYLGNRFYPNTVAYLGIPYAEPPVGELRFRTTVPLNTTRVVINATTFAYKAVRPERLATQDRRIVSRSMFTHLMGPRKATICLYFYHHGGTHVSGNSRNWPFDDWVHQSPNVVVVSMYYRLNSFGWLATPDFKDSAYGDFNVKQYIVTSGGDPDRVTINGQSAAGACVELNMVASHARGEQLFRRTIAQSVYRIPLPTPEQQQPLFQFYIDYPGCGAGSMGDQMACLRNASVSALARAQDAAIQGKFSGLYNVFHPVPDGVLFTEYPVLQFQRGQFTRVPLIVVYDSPVQQFRAASGEPEVTCGREAMDDSTSLYADTWTYRYNTPNPTIRSDQVTHAAENWLMFDGMNTGIDWSV
ncbi:Alpha/Beta hydrolase protein [Chiua virens]|nr:Alpha/Beta hydrolase protein [Chiua virens]